MTDDTEAEKNGVSARAVTLGHQLLTLCARQADWSQQVFGPDHVRGPVGALRHLQQEADEAISAPDDLTEYADCLLLLIDAARRAGFSIEQLVSAAADKQSVNAQRTWPNRDEQRPDEPVSHLQ